MGSATERTSKPRSTLSSTGPATCACFGIGTLVQRLAKAFTNPEPGRRARRTPDRGAGLGIARHAGGARNGHEAANPHQAHFPASLELSGHRSNEHVHSALRLRLVQPGLARDGVHQFSLGHPCLPNPSAELYARRSARRLTARISPSSNKCGADFSAPHKLTAISTLSG